MLLRHGGKNARLAGRVLGLAEGVIFKENGCVDMQKCRWKEGK